jgi:chromosome segregation ATPase
LERNVADTEARLKNDIRQKQQEAFEKIGAVEQQAELRSAEASRRLGALDLRMSGVQGGLGEHKRDILKLREEVNGLTVKSASHEVDIQKNSDAMRKMEKQRNMDEQNWKAQMDAVHDVLDTKVNEKPFEDLKHCLRPSPKELSNLPRLSEFSQAPGLTMPKALTKARQTLSCLVGRNVRRTCLSVWIRPGGSAARNGSVTFWT